MPIVLCTVHLSFMKGASDLHSILDETTRIICQRHSYCCFPLCRDFGSFDPSWILMLLSNTARGHGCQSGLYTPPNCLTPGGSLTVETDFLSLCSRSRSLQTLSLRCEWEPNAPSTPKAHKNHTAIIDSKWEPERPCPAQSPSFSVKSPEMQKYTPKFSKMSGNFFSYLVSLFSLIAYIFLNPWTLKKPHTFLFCICNCLCMSKCDPSLSVISHDGQFHIAIFLKNMVCGTQN